MSILTPTQIQTASQAFATYWNGLGNVANLSTTQIAAGITAIDTLMADTPAAVATLLGSTYSGQPNLGSVFGAAVSAAVPGSTSQQQAFMLTFWLKQLYPIP
jgi:hypothetical protein